MGNTIVIPWAVTLLTDFYIVMSYTVLCSVLCQLCLISLLVCSRKGVAVQLVQVVPENMGDTIVIP